MCKIEVWGLEILFNRSKNMLAVFLKDLIGISIPSNNVNSE